METWEWIVIAAVIVAAIVVVVGMWGWSARRRAHLRDRFGPEYDRAVSDSGRRDAERRLAAVQDAGHPGRRGDQVRLVRAHLE